MKKALKLLSAILCLAMVFSMFAALPASAEASAENLIQYPNFTLKDDGTISGWSFDSNNAENDSYAIETDEDGYNAIVIDKVSRDHNFNLGTTGVTKLSADKYYKLSVWIKMDENSLGSYTYASWAIGSLILKEGTSSRYNITEIFPTADVKGLWKEYSIIISGENFYTEESGYTELSLYVYGIACKYYIKNPSIAEYNPDVVEEVAKIETPNLISNGDFSDYSETDGFTGWVKGGNTAAQSAILNIGQSSEVPQNSSSTSSVKITVKNQNDEGYYSNVFGKSSTLSTSKNYRFSMWVKITNPDANYTSNAFDNDGRIRLGFRGSNGNDSKFSEKFTTKDEWTKLSFVLTGAEITEMALWAGYDVSICLNIYGMCCDIYVADACVEEFVGDVSVVNAENIVTNGDFETYDADANSFSGWSYFNGNSSQNLMGMGEGVNGNAFIFSSANTNGCPTATYTVTIDPTKMYTASVMVKVEDSSVTNNFGYAAWGGGIRMAIMDSTATVSVQSDIISAKTDGWVKLNVDIPALPTNATSLKITLAIGSTKANVYFDDVTILPVIGGSISANRENANAGDIVYVTVNPDWGKKLAENGLSYLASGATESVAITENKSDVYTLVTGADSVERKVYTSVASDNPNIYQFAMPQNADVVISAVFEDIALVAGDIDWDGTVNVLDIVRLKKYIGGIEVQINTDNATLESETAEIDGLDLTILRQILLGIK